jgi:hypothetical protein
MVIKGATNQEEFEPSVYFQYFESDKGQVPMSLNTEGLNNYDYYWIGLRIVFE